MPTADRRLYSDGTAIWYIDNLWPIANDLPVFDFVITDLPQLDEVGWFSDAWGKRATYRAVIDHCRRILAADTSWPVILAPVDAPHHGCILDGIHRIAKTLLDGGSTVRALRLRTMPPPDEWIAAGDPRFAPVPNS